MSGALSIDVPPELVDSIVEQVLERLGDQAPAEPTTGYLDVTGAAAYLACNKSRVYALVSAGRIPFYKDGSRLLFLPCELRSYVANGGARRP